MWPVIGVPRRSTVFPSTLTGFASLAEKASPRSFLTVFRVWRTVAVISVPIGKVMRWSGGVAWMLAARLTVAALAGSATGFAGLAIAVRAGSSAVLAALAAALLLAWPAVGAGWLLATVAGCSEHAAAVKQPRTAAASDSL